MYVSLYIVMHYMWWGLWLTYVRKSFGVPYSKPNCLNNYEQPTLTYYFIVFLSTNHISFEFYIYDMIRCYVPFIWCKLMSQDFLFLFVFLALLLTHLRFDASQTLVGKDFNTLMGVYPWIVGADIYDPSWAVASNKLICGYQLNLMLDLFWCFHQLEIVGYKY